MGALLPPVRPLDTEYQDPKGNPALLAGLHRGAPTAEAAGVFRFQGRERREGRSGVGHRRLRIWATSMFFPSTGTICFELRLALGIGIFFAFSFDLGPPGGGGWGLPG